MGGALAKAASQNGSNTLLLANRHPEKAQKLAEIIGGTPCDNLQAASEADYLFLGVKPQMLEGMLDGVRDVLDARQDRFVIVSMCAGKDLRALAALLGERPIVRIMPNIPVAVGGGVTLLCASPQVTEEEKARLKALLGAAGLVAELDEHQMDAASGVTGCGPAFAAMFVEALADGAVACGLPRREAIRLAAQMMKGTAELLLETGEHPGALKDRVCSPAGSTIQGVRRLEESAFRAAVMNAVIATFEKKF